MNYNKALDNGAGGADEISDQQIKNLIGKFTRKGFDGLSLEEVASAMIIPNFAKIFNQHTGLDWTGKFEVKALERLNRSKFDIGWMARKDNSQEHSALFINCVKGDLPKVRQYLKECRDPNIKLSVDQTKKSPLHLAAIEGHLSTVELLVLSGFNPNARDRTLKTPLHYSSLYGHESVSDTLIKAGSDLMARDSLGRSSIHFAASSPSALVLQLILATKPELVNDLDHKRRTPLHYCVWNSTQNQVDLLRTLLDFKANPMALDEDLKTPVHHASEGGKTRALPLLLQRGGQDSMQLRDKSQKTPLELALNDRTREVLIVYSSYPLNHNQDDLKYLNQAVQGNKLGAKEIKKEVNSQVRESNVQVRESKEQVPLKEFPVVPKEVLAVPPPKPTAWTPASINSWIREKFFTILKKVQESGIQANHHLKRPYVYTGSWMEGIHNMEELFAAIKDIPAAEACIRTFNILCPFDRELPPSNGLEDVVDGFYGEQWFDGAGLQLRTEQLEEQRRKMQQEYLTRITDLETAIQIKDRSQFDTDQQLAQARAQLEVLKRSTEEEKQKLNKQLDTINRQLKSKEEQMNKSNKEIQTLHEKIQSLEAEIEEVRNQPQGISEEEAQQYQQQITELREQLQKEKDTEKTLRNKAGQLFLKTIQNQKQRSEEQIQLAKQQAAQEIQAKEKDYKQKLTSAEQMALNAQKQADLVKDQAAKQLQQQSEQLQLKNQQQLDLEKKKIAAEILPTNQVGGLDNLQDDDAIVALLKTLKGNPPPMRQRMKNVDVDLDGKLTQDEFKQFLNGLKLSQQDILSLCRVAGFVGGKKLLGIDEFAQILKDRPEQRKQFEQLLFAKLIDAIKAKGLTVDKMFELIDTDGSGSLSPAELKEGLRSLKIILNQKDLNNMFCIFDSDKSGSIQLNEMKETLDTYDKLRNQINNDEIVSEASRIKDVDDDNPYSQVDPQDLEYQQDIKEWHVDINDFKNMSGDIKVQLVTGSPIDAKAIICRVMLRGVNQVEKEIILFNKSEFNRAFILQLRNELLENVCDVIIVQIYKNKILEENFVGDVKVMWKSIVQQPNKYVINNKFQLTNTTYIKEQAKMFKPQGFVNLQLKFIPLQSDNQELGLWNLKTTQPTFTSTIVEEGVLEIIAVQCILNEEHKQLQEPKFFCHVKFMDVDEKIKAKLTAKNDLYFDSKYLQDLKLVTNSPIPQIYVKIYVETPRNLVMSNTTILGEFYINWDECIQNPGDYLSQKSYLISPNEKMYIKIRYIPQSMFQNIVGFRDGVSKANKKRELQLEDMQSGTMKILFVRGKNMRADDGDTSDPYIVAKILSFDKEIKIQSKTIKKTLNPEWKDLQVIKLQIPKESPYPPLELELFDQDVLGDDELGKFKIDIEKAVQNPCTWGINEYFDVIDPKAKQPGQVYLQVYWVPQGMKDPNLKARDKDDSTFSQNSDPNLIQGVMMVKVVHARELAGQSIDPYVTVQFPGQKELKTESISSSNNPVYNQLLTQQLSIQKDKVDIPLKVFVKDSNLFSDTVLGFVDVNWNESYLKPGEWAINQVFNLSATAESKQFGSIGYLYLQIKFLEAGMIDDSAEAPLVENLFEIINSKQGMYQGCLRIFLVHARNLVIADDKTSDPYVVFKVPGGKKLETQAKKETLNPSWKTIYNINISMPKDTIQPLRVEVYDDDLMGDDFIGYATVDLKECFNNPQQWKFNEVLDLLGDLKMQQKYKTTKFGKIYLQIMFCLQGIQNNDPPLPLTEDLDVILREQQQENKKPMKGSLVINIPVALGIKAGDEFTSDPYVKIIFPDGHSVKSKQIEKTLNPIFNFQYKWNCNLIKEQYKPLKLELYDADNLRDDLLSEQDVEWLECFNNPTQWMVNHLYQLNEGKAYVQCKFLLQGQEATQEGMRACDTIQELKNDYGRVLGKINVKIISASQLYNADITGKSDPFVECFLSSETNKMKTKVVENDLNPKFDFEGSLLIDMLRCQVQSNTIQFEVKDDDEIGSDILGSVDVDLIDILEKNPGSLVTQDYPLKDPSKKGNPNLGNLKVQLSWFPDPYNEGVVGLRIPPKMYTGTLVVKFPNARKLPKGDPYIEFQQSSNLEKSWKCKNQDSKQDPIFDYEERIQLELSERQVIIERLIVKVMNYNMAWKNTVLGGISVQITDVLKKGTWINQYQQLYDDDGKQIESYLYVQVGYYEDIKNIQYPPAIDFDQFINANKPKTFSGNLQLTYVGVKGLRNADITGLSDPFVEFKLSKGSLQSLKTSTQDDRLECFWKDVGIYAFKDLLLEDLQSLTLYIQVFDYDYSSNDLLGKTEIPLNMKSGQWINQRIPLLDEKDFPQKSEIYLQAQLIIDGEPLLQEKQPVNLYEEVAEQQKQEQLKKKLEEDARAAIPKLPGSVRVFAINAKNLKKADTFGQSDPFVEFKLSKCSKQILKTNTIDDNQNPVWNYNGEFKLDMQPQEYTQINLMCTVYDYDTIASSDFLGFIELSLDDLFQKPGTWINNIFKLKDEHGNTGESGEIYLQVQWVPDNQKQSISLVQPKQLDQPIIQQNNPAPLQPQNNQGVLQINIIKLLGYDQKNQIKLKLDKYPDKLIQSNLVQPGVDYNLKQPLEVLNIDGNKLEIQLFDEKAAVIALTQIDINQIIQNPGQWINEFYSFTQNNVPQYQLKVYVQIQWQPLNKQVDNKEPPLIPDPVVIVAPPKSQTQVQPKGKLKVAVISASGFILLDGGKSSNTKITVTLGGSSNSTSCVKGALPIWKVVLDPFKCLYDKIEQVQLQVQVFHDPGVFSKCIMIGEVNIKDLSSVFIQPNQWALKNDFILGGTIKEAKQNATGFVTLWIGFIPEKDKDTLLKI